jgi:hypothetical protein
MSVPGEHKLPPDPDRDDLPPEVGRAQGPFMLAG